MTTLIWLVFTLWSASALAAPERPVPATPAAEATTPSAAPSPTATDDVTVSEEAEAEEDEARPEKRRRHRRGPRDGAVRFGQSMTIAAGETHKKDVVVFGGSVTIAGSQRGDVVVFGGSVDISGDVVGDVVVFGGGVDLTSTARIDGDVVSLGGAIKQDPGAVIRGESVGLPGAAVAAGFVPATLLSLGSIGLGLSIFAWVKTAGLALLLGLVIAAVLPVQVEASATVLRERWLACLGVGLLAFLAAFPLTLLLCLTCVGSVIPYLFYQVAKYFGLTVLFIVVGHAVGRAASQRDLGTMAALLVGFLVLSLIGLLAPAWLVYGWLGVGVSLLTRFGTMRPWWNRDRQAVTTT